MSLGFCTKISEVRIVLMLYDDDGNVMMMVDQKCEHLPAADEVQASVPGTDQHRH